MSQVDDLERFDFLRVAAEGMGALQAKAIPADLVVVEHRVTRRCRSGCRHYGSKLTCPPHVPTPDQFREILGDYSTVLIVRFPPLTESDDDPDRHTTESTWEGEEEGNPVEPLRAPPQILDVMLELERLAIARGHVSAIALIHTSCRLCDTCNIRNGVCLHPTRARIPGHAVGIDIRKTAEMAGMSNRRRHGARTDPMALLLVD